MTDKRTCGNCVECLKIYSQEGLDFEDAKHLSPKIKYWTCRDGRLDGIQDTNPDEVSACSHHQYYDECFESRERAKRCLDNVEKLANEMMADAIYPIHYGTTPRRQVKWEDQKQPASPTETTGELGELRKKIMERTADDSDIELYIAKFLNPFAVTLSKMGDRLDLNSHVRRMIMGYYTTPKDHIRDATKKVGED